MRYEFSGREAITHLNFTLHSYFREFIYNGYVFAIEHTKQQYTSDTFSGYVGLAPYTAIDNQGGNQRVQITENFMYQLK